MKEQMSVNNTIYDVEAVSKRLESMQEYMNGILHRLTLIREDLIRQAIDKGYTQEEINRILQRVE